jgi:hypothetical protein
VDRGKIRARLTDGKTLYDFALYDKLLYIEGKEIAIELL